MSSKPFEVDFASQADGAKGYVPETDQRTLTRFDAENERRDAMMERRRERAAQRAAKGQES